MEKMNAADCQLRLHVKRLVCSSLIGVAGNGRPFVKSFQIPTGLIGQKGVGIPRHEINKISRAQFVNRTSHNFVCAEVGDVRCYAPFRRTSAEESANRCSVQQQNQAAFIF
jgi:hypothetical protein